ncbi:MAG TPA: rhomboid family intramembrane serine protease [Acidimicrobiales bacterium]|nr:rhomboid family intramembrane serine protease [Acidimicrobiales bacterium]
MIPLKDENPTETTPVVTIVLIAACVAVWILIQGGGQRQDDTEFTVKTAAIPCEVVKGRPLSEEELIDTYGPSQDQTACVSDPDTPAGFPKKRVFVALLFSMFMHGSWIHLGGNMLFLWVFGNNIEDRLGGPKFLAFYLAAGLVATAAHIAVQPNSTVPLVGASGAIAGVMGAYLVLYPNVRIKSLIFLGFFVMFRDVAAKWLLGIWLVSQFFINPNEGVAWMAHVGGFVFGVVAGFAMRGAGEPESPEFPPGPSPAPWRYS